MRDVLIEELVDWMGAWAPWDTAEEWDNCGLLVRTADRVTGAVCALDITPEAIAFAREKGCNTLVSHHPVIFHPLKQLCAQQPAMLAARACMNALCAHTNLDKAPGGVCETLARAIGLEGVRPTAGFCWLGRLPAPLPLSVLARQVADRLAVPAQYTAGLAEKQVCTVAVVSGAGGDLFGEAAALGADCLVTGEAGHHDFLDAVALGLPLVAAGHWGTERLIAPVLARRLEAAFPGLPVFAFEGQPPMAAAGPANER